MRAGRPEGMDDMVEDMLLAGIHPPTSPAPTPGDPSPRTKLAQAPLPAMVTSQALWQRAVYMDISTCHRLFSSLRVILLFCKCEAPVAMKPGGRLNTPTTAFARMPRPLLTVTFAHGDKIFVSKLVCVFLFY